LIENQPLIAEKFNNHSATIGSDLARKIPTCNRNAKDYLKGNYKNSIFLSPTTPQEVSDTIAVLKNTESRGFDDIPLKIIKNNRDGLSKIISHIVDSSFTEGIFPDALKIAKVIPVYKNGDDKAISNYRPISILPIFSKIFEKLMCVRLNKYLLDNLILHPNQFGFRSNLSTSTALIQIVDEISRSIDEKKITIGGFIDLAKAFDTVNHGILLNKLEHWS